MADNISITAGSGTTIATDQVSWRGVNAQAQVVKIIDATNNGTSKLLIGSSGELSVKRSAAWGATVTQGGVFHVGATITQGGALNINRVTTVTTITNPVAVTKSGTWGLTVTGTVSAAKSGTWGMTVSGTVSAAKSGTWGMTVSQATAANLKATVSQGGAWTVNAVTTVATVTTITNAVAVTKSGTWSTTVTQGTAQNLKAMVSGTTAHDSAAVGLPVMTGGRARSTVATTIVTTNDAVFFVADTDAVQVVRPQIPLGSILVESVNATTSASTAFSTFNATTLVRNYITSAVITNKGATFLYIDFRNGTGGSVIATFPVPSGGGVIMPFPMPLRQTSTNTALAYDSSAALGSGYSISLVGYQSKL